MKLFSLLLISLNFLLFIVGAFVLFSKPNEGEKPRLLNSVLIVGLMLGILYTLYKADNIPWYLASTGILLLLGSLLLFTWTAWIHRGQKLSPLNSTDIPTHLVQKGPYQFIRHPYYTSYILSFFAGAVLANSTGAMVGVLGIFYLYVEAADQEEDKFASSSLSGRYKDYRMHTGKFFPKLFPNKSILNQKNTRIRV